MTQLQTTPKFISKKQFNRKPKLPFEQRMKNKSAYFKRRLIRLVKRAGWLKRKNSKRLKRIRKQRRYYTAFTGLYKRILVRYKKVSQSLNYSNYNKTVLTVSNTEKTYKPNLVKYKISQHKRFFTSEVNKFNYCI